MGKFRPRGNQTQRLIGYAVKQGMREYNRHKPRNTYGNDKYNNNKPNNTNISEEGKIATVIGMWVIIFAIIWLFSGV